MTLPNTDAIMQKIVIEEVDIEDEMLHVMNMIEKEIVCVSKKDEKVLFFIYNNKTDRLMVLTKPLEKYELTYSIVTFRYLIRMKVELDKLYFLHNLDPEIEFPLVLTEIERSLFSSDDWDDLDDVFNDLKKTIDEFDNGLSEEEKDGWE